MVEYETGNGGGIDIEPPYELVELANYDIEHQKREILDAYRLKKPASTADMPLNDEEYTLEVVNDLRRWFFVETVRYGEEYVEFDSKRDEESDEYVGRVDNESAEVYENPISTIVVSRFKNITRMLAGVYRDINSQKSKDTFPHGVNMNHDIQGVLLWPKEAGGGSQELLINIAEFTKRKNSSHFK